MYIVHIRMRVCMKCAFCHTVLLYNNMPLHDTVYYRTYTMAEQRIHCSNTSINIVILSLYIKKEC